MTISDQRKENGSERSGKTVGLAGRSRPPFWMLFVYVVMTFGAPKSSFSTLRKKIQTALVSLQKVNENPTTDHLKTCFGAGLRIDSGFSPILIPFALQNGPLWASCWRPWAPKAPPARPKVPPELLMAPLWAPRVRPRRPQGPSDPAPATKTTPRASMLEAPGFRLGCLRHELFTKRNEVPTKRNAMGPTPPSTQP